MLFAVIAVFAMPADPVNVWLFAQEDPTAEIVEKRALALARPYRLDCWTGDDMYPVTTSRNRKC